MLKESLASVLQIDRAEIESGHFMGRQISTLDRDDLLAVIGWFARKDAAAVKISELNRPAY